MLGFSYRGRPMATRNKTGLRAELFGQMSNIEIVGEVVGSLMFFGSLAVLCLFILAQ